MTKRKMMMPCHGAGSSPTLPVMLICHSGARFLGGRAACGTVHWREVISLKRGVEWLIFYDPAMSLATFN